VIVGGGVGYCVAVLALLCVDKMGHNVCKSEIFAGNRGAAFMIYIRG